MSDAPTPLPPSPLLPAPVVAEPGSASSAPEALRKSKNKVRSAWISFAGRIAAQLIGAAATVLLGIYVASAYARHVGVGANPAAAVTTAPREGLATPTAVVRTRQGAGLSLVVLPFQDYTPGATSRHLVNGLTEALTATLARSGQVQVISRTSAMHVNDVRAPLPTIAAALGVDLVVEGSISRQGRRVRVTVQLIDARSDEHLWAQTYERTTRDLLTLEREVATAIAAELTTALPRSAHGDGGSATASRLPAGDADWRAPLRETR